MMMMIDTLLCINNIFSMCGVLVFGLSHNILCSIDIGSLGSSSSSYVCSPLHTWLNSTSVYCPLLLWCWWWWWLWSFTSAGCGLSISERLFLHGSVRTITLCGTFDRCATPNSMALSGMSSLTSYYMINSMWQPVNVVPLFFPIYMSAGIVKSNFISMRRGMGEGV